MLRIGHHPYLSSEAAASDGIGKADDGLKRIFRLLQGKNGTDFSRYKRSTVQRRLAHRMALRQIHGLTEYAELLKHEPEEVQALAQDFLIRVTGFFRDPETFVGLTETVYPIVRESLFQRHASDLGSGLRFRRRSLLIAMVLMEYLGDRASSVRLQISAPI